MIHFCMNGSAIHKAHTTHKMPAPKRSYNFSQSALVFIFLLQPDLQL